MNTWQKIHIAPELIGSGHSITYFNPLIYSTSRAKEELCKLARSKQFDVFINSMGSDFISKHEISEISKAGIFTILICYDNTHSPFMHKDIASSFDLVWLTSYDNINIFKNWNSNIIIQPYACNPDIFKPHWDDRISKICFIGTPYGYRTNIINTLTSNFLDVDLYADISSNIRQNDLALVNKYFFINILNNLKIPIGRKILLSKIISKIKSKPSLIDNSHLSILKPLKFEDISKKYSNSTLSLNVIELRNTGVLKNPVLKLHLRTFEIPMSGGLMLVRRSKELENYFDDRKEVLCYDSEDEMISLAKYFLFQAKDKEVLKMKINARKRSIAEHTWSHRFNAIFNKIK